MEPPEKVEMIFALFPLDTSKEFGVSILAHSLL
jgi:hypothetical protein